MHSSTIPSYLVTIIALVVLGGLGFPVLSALLALRPWETPVQRLQRRLPVGVRLVLVTTAILIVGGMLLLWGLERNGVFRHLSIGDQWLHALFLSVVPRTAGFNSVPISELSVPASLVIIILMWIGASPASTGGGVKTLTVAVALLGAVQLLRGRKRVEAFHREIPIESLLKAFVALLSSAAFLLTVTVILQVLEPNTPLLDLLFEAASALGTVGLSRGVTEELSPASKLLLVTVMLIGRIGVLTVLSVLIPARPAERYYYPRERIIIT
ncbi:MAG: potassium transporter TrkG [Bacteroidota bacterium]|nr:potassium transporter TrkG [Bacteroidota bacterium]